MVADLNNISESVKIDVQNAMREPQFASGLKQVTPVAMSAIEVSTAKSPSPTPNLGIGQAISKG